MKNQKFDNIIVGPSRLGSEDELLSSLQLVVLDCPYDTLNEKTTQEYFSKYLAIKLNGFLKEYPHGVMPFGSYDFVASILMLCERKGGELIPGFCFKITHLDRTRYFGLPFELLEWFHSPAEELHKKAVLRILDHADACGTNVGYNSSWVIHPEWRKDPLRKHVARNLTLTFMDTYYSEFDIPEVLIGGVERFKVDQFQAFMGFRDLMWNNESLPAVEAWFVRGEKAKLMHLTAFSPEAQAITQRYRSLWDQRMTIEARHVDPIYRKAA